MTNGPAKISAMVFSTVTALVITPLIYTIIVFDYNTHNRTLINHMLASLMACGIFWNLVMQPLTFLRYIVGPVDSAFICAFDTVLRNSICMHALFLFDSIIIVRYIFMFHLKNPTALQDHFWNLFINMWSIAAFTLSQTVYCIMPGKNPMNFYMCTGHFPPEYQNRPVKINLPTTCLALFSLVVHLVVGTINFYFKSKQSFNSSQSLVTYTSNMVGTLSLLFVSFIIPLWINRMDPEELDVYPNYILLYVQHHYMTQFNMILSIAAYLYKSQALRKKVLEVILSFQIN